MYIREGIFSLRIYVTVISLYPPDWGVTLLLVYMHDYVVLTFLQVLLYSLRVSGHSRASYPIGLGLAPFMGFVVATENALRPRAYFSPYGLTHSLQASHTID